MTLDREERNKKNMALGGGIEYTLKIRGYTASLLIPFSIFLKRRQYYRGLFQAKVGKGLSEKIIFRLWETRTWASHVALVVKNPPTNAGDIRDTDSIPGLGRCPGEGNATHSSILAWEIPWTEEPDRLQFIELQRVGYN